MSITPIFTTSLPLSQIEVNKGQIIGLPKNPRLIKDNNFNLLVKSIQDNPEMLALRELLVYPIADKKYIVIGGNMRFRALKELKYKEAPCKIIPKSATVEQLKAYTLKDNSGYGRWDFDLLANEWELDLIEDCAIEIPNITYSDGEDKPTKDDTKESTRLTIEFKDAQEYAKVIAAIATFDNNMRIGIIKALGING